MKNNLRDRRSLVYFFSSKMLVVALNASTGILTARALHVAGRGELAAVRLWPMLLSGSLTLGVPSAATFYIRRHPQHRAALVEAAVLMTLVVGIFGSAIAIFFTPSLLANYTPSIVLLVRWLMPSLIIGLFLLVGRAILEADNNFARSGLILLMPPTFSLLGLLGLTTFHRLTPLYAGAIYVFADIPTLAILWPGLRFSLRSSFREVRDAAGLLLSYGLRVYGVDLCGTVSFYIDQAVVVELLTPSDMGYYAVSLSFSRIMSVPHQALATILFPRLIDLDKKRISDVLEQMLRIGGTLALVLGALAVVAGRSLLGTLYGKAFAQDLLVLPILTLEAGLSGCVLIVAQAFMALNRPTFITIQQIAGLIASIPLLLILVPAFGVRGAALSVLFSTLLRLLFISTSYRVVFGSLPSLLMNHESYPWLKKQVLSTVTALAGDAAAEGRPT